MLKIAYTQAGMLMGNAEDPNKLGVTVFKEPRVIQVTNQVGNQMRIEIKMPFGNPDFVEVPSGFLITNVTDKQIIDPYRQATSGIIIPSPVIDINRYKAN